MTEGKWNCMWPMVLGRCVPKTGLTRVAWACTLLETEILGIHNPEDSAFLVRTQVRFDWQVELSVRLEINSCPFLSLSSLLRQFSSIIPESLAFWNTCWAQLHGDLVTGVGESCLKSLSVYNPRGNIVLFYYLLMILWLILIKPYSECWIGCTQKVPVENKRKKKMVSPFLFQKP